MDFQRHFLAMWRRILSAASCHSLALVPVFLGRLFSKFCDFSQPLNWYPPPSPLKTVDFIRATCILKKSFLWCTKAILSTKSRRSLLFVLVFKDAPGSTTFLPALKKLLPKRQMHIFINTEWISDIFCYCS